MFGLVSEPDLTIRGPGSRHECDRGVPQALPIGKFSSSSGNHTSEKYDLINWLGRSERLAADERDPPK
jgi:hypothetical protein